MTSAVTRGGDWWTETKAEPFGLSLWSKRKSNAKKVKRPVVLLCLMRCFEGNDWQERGRLSLIPADPSQRQPSRGDLVFYQNSPAFCDADTAIGHHGVAGRRCNATSRGEDGCQRMCCGRGYTSTTRPGRERCNCVFHWCCRVTCDTCIVHHIEHTCI